MEEITSTLNPRIKLIKSLKLSKNRKKEGLFVVEGERIVKEALASDFEIFALVLSKSFFDRGNDLGDFSQGILVSDEIFSSLCDTKSPQGILCVLKAKENDWENYGDIVLALEDVQDPSNVGTIIRTADAFGVTSVLLSKGCADVYSPKVLRGSMGSVFHLPTKVESDFTKELQQLKDNGYTLVAGDLKGSSLTKISGKRVIIVGNEGNGISEATREMCTVLWKIEMNGKAESLNASIAAGIMLYTLTK